MRLSPVISLFLVLLGVFAGCPSADAPNDNGIDNGNANGSDSVDSAPASERLAALDRVEQAIAGIDLDGDPAGSDRIVAALSAMSDFASVGTYHDNVFARFADGELLIIVNNRGAGDNTEAGETAEAQLKSGIAERIKKSDDARLREAAGPRAQSSDQARVPSSKKAILINTMGSAYRDSTNLFGGWLTGAGYDASNVEGTVEGLRTGVRDVGVLYISAHGAAISATERPKGLEGFFPDDADLPPPSLPFTGSAGKDQLALWTKTINNDSTNCFI
jgi:hypothetical protein